MLSRSPAVVGVVLAATLLSGAGHLRGRDEATGLVARRSRATLDRVAVVGDSMLAGFASGGLVRRGNPGQADDAASLLARAAKAKLRQPAIDAPGAPPQLAIVDADRDGQLGPGEVRRAGDGVGARKSPKRRTQNLAVPGETLSTVFDAVGRADAGSARDAAGAGRSAQKLLVLGEPSGAGEVSQLSRLRALAPTLALVWIGNDDLLDVTAGYPVRRYPGGRIVGAHV